MFAATPVRRLEYGPKIMSARRSAQSARYISAHRTGSLASSWHSSVNSHRSPATRSALLALASAMNKRMAISACRPIGEYSPVRESDRPMVIFTGGRSGCDFGDAALDDGVAVGIESLVGENFAAVFVAVGPNFCGDSLAGKHGTREAHAQALEASRVAGAEIVDRDLRRKRHRAKAMHDDARQARHLRDVFIDMDRVAIAGGLGVAVGLILVDGLRDREDRLAAIGLDGARFRGRGFAVSSASNKSDEECFIDRLAFLVGGVQLDGHGLTGGLGFDRNNFCGRGYY